jgi:type III pantothenate kinase
MILADIGNSFIKFYQKGGIQSFEIQDGIKRFKDDEVRYISVNNRIDAIPSNWIDIAQTIEIDTSYVGLGIDRKAVCLAVSDGVIVDAGSAITVDIMQNGVHLGGYILPGIEAYTKAYASISPKLQTTFNPHIDLHALPQSTKDAISFAVIKSITSMIQSTARGNVYITGGDGKFLSTLIENSIYDETLLFKGMMKGLQC